MSPEVCPNCGAGVPPRARACPECGSDESTGWSEASAYDGLDLPDEDFYYDRYVEREFGKRGPVPEGIHWFWWLVGVVLLIALSMFLVL